jgi:hypothetical protein
MISIVKSLGAVIVEVLGDPKWTERLRDASTRYDKHRDYGSGATPKSQKDTKRYGENLSTRAKLLALRNEKLGGEAAQPYFKRIIQRTANERRQEFPQGSPRSKY